MPVGTLLPDCGATVAVNVTLCPGVTWVAEAESVVVVATTALRNHDTYRLRDRAVVLAVSTVRGGDGVCARRQRGRAQRCYPTRVELRSSQACCAIQECHGTSRHIGTRLRGYCRGKRYVLTVGDLGCGSRERVVVATVPCETTTLTACETELPSLLSPP